MNHASPWKTLTGLAALAAIASLSSGCFALQSRIEGENYSAASPPYIAEGAARIEANAALPEQADLIHRVVLVGDAGVPMDSEPVLESLTRWADAHAEQTSVLFLGDNVYPAGVEEDAVEEGEEILRKQVSATRATRIFVPGNHDWGHVGADRLLRQQSYLDANGVEFIPRDGCPGPVLRPLLAPGAETTRGISFLAFDIDPWYFGEDVLPNCPGNKTPEELGAELGQLLKANEGQWMLVGAHHPLRTGGPHGGFSRGALADFLTGALFLVFGTLQDTYEEPYRAIMAPIERALAAAPPTLYVAGHDHNLQVLEGGDHADYQLISGAGATVRVRDGHVTNIDGTLFAHGHAGFMVVDFIRTEAGERAVLHVVETENDAPVFSMEIGTR
jgi:hypothetical protein